MLRSIKNFSYFNFFCCFLSAGLLIFAFPKTDLWICAWGGLVPLLFVLDGKKPLSAFCWAYLCGLLFFAGTLFWFFHITVWFSTIAAVGIILLLLYLAVYFGLFGLGYSFFSQQKPLFKLFLLPSIWVVLEFIRAHLFTGFGWVSLGHSQYKNLPLIQIADITGVYGVSFIVLMGNILIKEYLTASFVDKNLKAQRVVSVLAWTTTMVIILVLGYGMVRLLPLKNQSQADANFSVAVIQANTPQAMKWKKPAWPGIMEKYIGLTKQAVAHNPDLIIWPETSYPGYLWEDKALFTELQKFVHDMQIPLLLGSVIKEDRDYYNAVMLLSKDGDIVETYRKIHLVPFGEYLPLRSIFPFLAELVPLGDFTAGKQWTTFPIESAQGNQFSVLICFEDTVARLSRQFVQKGAQLLVNMTNDAWFGDSKAPFMHLQSSVFRTIENRRGLVRVANTGVSCFINQWGQIVQYLEKQVGAQKQKTYISDYAIGKVDFNEKTTPYTKFGDVFTIFCFGCILLGIGKQMKTKGYG